LIDVKDVFYIRARDDTPSRGLVSASLTPIDFHMVHERAVSPFAIVTDLLLLTKYIGLLVLLRDLAKHNPLAFHTPPFATASRTDTDYYIIHIERSPRT